VGEVARRHAAEVQYYPTPALVLGLPFAGLSVMGARILFAATTCGLCVSAILRWRPHSWPLLCTGPFVYALQRGQWSPLLLTAGLVPAAGVVLIAKPTIGAAVFAYRPSKLAAITSAGLAVIALAMHPEWPVRWIEAARGTQHVLSPMLLPGGWVLASVLLRWRRPEARLLGLLALMPQTTSMYELVPLALLPRTTRQSVFLACTFNLLYAVSWTLYGRPFTPADLHSNSIPASWIPMLTLGYLPALWLVLRPFPLWGRSQESIARPRWSRRAHVAIWTLVLALIVFWALAGVWFIWRYLLPRFLWH